MLYADPRTAVVTNELFSPFLGVTRGTYQGHSLSLVLESFGTTIGIAKTIKGGEKEDKFLFYADDIPDPEFYAIHNGHYLEILSSIRIHS